MTHYDTRNAMMLVSLNIRSAQGNKLDRKATAELCATKGVDEGNARVRKTTIPKKMLADVNRWVGSARHYHSDNTLPWSDKGDRVLMVGNYLEYMHGMEKIKQGFFDAVEAFTRTYTKLRTLMDQDPEKAQEVLENYTGEKLGDLFDVNDYPYPSELEGAFGFNIHVTPIPQGADFRCDVGNEEVERIQADVDRRINEAIAESYKDTFSRLYKSVTDMAKKLRKRNDNPSSPIFDSMVDNLTEQLDVLDRMAAGYDPKLASMVKEARFLVKLPSDVLKEQPTARNQVITAADTLASKLEAFI